MMASYLTAHGDTKESVIFAFHVRCGSIDLSSFHFVKLHGGIYVYTDMLKLNFYIR